MTGEDIIFEQSSVSDRMKEYEQSLAYLEPVFYEDPEFQISVPGEEPEYPESDIIQGSVYSLLREMEIGDRLLAEVNLWDQVRSTAAILKKEFGAVFTVNKVRTKRMLAYILVRRIK